MSPIREKSEPGTHRYQIQICEQVNEQRSKYINILTVGNCSSLSQLAAASPQLFQLPLVFQRKRLHFLGRQIP